MVIIQGDPRSERGVWRQRAKLLAGKAPLMGVGWKADSQKDTHECGNNLDEELGHGSGVRQIWVQILTMALPTNSVSTLVKRIALQGCL